MKNKQKKYYTNPNYMTLTKIAQVMTDRGYPMNHSTVRNHLNSGLSKIAYALLVHNGTPENEAKEKCFEIGKSPYFQEYLVSMLEDINIVDD